MSNNQSVHQHQFINSPLTPLKKIPPTPLSKGGTGTSKTSIKKFCSSTMMMIVKVQQGRSIKAQQGRGIKAPLIKGGWGDL